MRLKKIRRNAGRIHVKGDALKSCPLILILPSKSERTNMSHLFSDENGDGDNTPTLTGHHAGAISDFSLVVFTQGNLARGEGPRPSSDVTPTFQSNAGDQHPCVFTQNSRSEVREMGDRTGAVTSERGAQCQNYLKIGMAVRRLTPRECERLQGFSDNYTLIDWRGKPKEECPDGPRYKAIGNSMAVPVMRWIGMRIQQVESIGEGR